MDQNLKEASTQVAEKARNARTMLKLIGRKGICSRPTCGRVVYELKTPDGRLLLDANLAKHHPKASCADQPTERSDQEVLSLAAGLVRALGNESRCFGKDCRQPIIWIMTDREKMMPFNLDYSPHHASCRNVDDFRRK